MQKKFIHFVGIDISKEKFDAALIWQSNKNQILHKEFTNNRTGIKAFLKCFNSLLRAERYKN